MPDKHLRQPEFTYSASRPLTKNKERIQKFKETRDSRYIYYDELPSKHLLVSKTSMVFMDMKT